ncbi:MAG: WD40/YVTN/BNR-like repeat-containing protein [Acidobacteriota bacterium]
MRHITLTALAVGATAVLLAAQSAGTQTPTPDETYVSRHAPRATQVGPGVSMKDEADGRIEWMREVYGDISPEFVSVLLTEAARQQQLYPNANPGAVKPGAPGAWTNIGPVRSNWVQNGPTVTESDTGRVRTILVDPGDANTVYVLTSGGGLWKTTNFGDPVPTWRAMSDGVVSTSGGSISFGRNPRTLYFGVGDPFDRFVGGFIARSTDGGATWAAIKKLGASLYVPDVKVDTSATQDIVLAGTDAGLFRSTDGGTSYLQDATIGNRIVWSLARTSAGWLALAQDRTAGTLGRLFLSTDAGATWAPTGASLVGEIGRATLAVGSPGDSVVYAFAATTNNGAQKDLYRSLDGGVTWAALGLGSKTPVNPNEDQPDMDIMAGQAFYNQMVLVDPADGSRGTVYIGGQLSSAKTTDGGQTWTIITNWLAQFGLPYVHADFHAAAFTTLNKSQAIIFGTDGGIFVSTDGGRQFSSQKNDGISSNLIYALISNPKHPDDVLIGLQDDGTRLRVGPTNTFNQVFGGDGFGVGWSQANDAVALACFYYSAIIRTRNNPPSTQAKWYVGWDGIAEFFNPSLTYFFTAIETPTGKADPSGLTFFHRTRFKLYRTTDGADNWTALLDTTPTGIALRAGMHPIGVSPDDLQHFGVLGNSARFWQTEDGGATFTQRNLTGVAGGWPGFNSTVAYADNSTLYVGNESASAVPRRLIKSVDGGATWGAADSGLPNVPVTRILVSTRDTTKQTVYAGTWLGVYESTNGGSTWHLFGTGLPLVNVSDLYMPPDGSYLRISTYGRGVWDYRF